MRYFNVAGVCLPGLHYMLPPEQRLPGVRELVVQRAYLAVHAPRQTGKTTSLRALCQVLTAEGQYAALHFSCEGGQAVGEDYAAAERIIWNNILMAARNSLPAELRPHAEWVPAAEGASLQAQLAGWSRACPRPLVLVFDEIDALLGSSLISVLRQLRAGHPERGEAYPSSVILCGLRDVRDYKAASGGDATRLGTASPFNVLVKSIGLGNFTADEVAALYGQHTADTGQPFTPDALQQAWALTGGQPWLVNALAREVIDEMRVRPPTPITAEHLDVAKEHLILARATHLDSLVSKLHEPRVRRVIEPMIAGMLPGGDPYDDDFSYVADLGIIARGLPVRVANPIYREVIVRVLALQAERAITAEPRSFIQPDGTLDMQRVLHEFAEFWREHGDILANGISYHEVAPQLVIMAWLQRVVNGGGYVIREYGIGRGRIDLLVRWPHADAQGQRLWQRAAIELKVWAAGKPDPLAKGLAQLDTYLERLGLASGVLVIFDRRPEAADIALRTIFEQVETPGGRGVTLLRA